MTEQLKFTLYKIVNDTDDKLYIGSTRLSLGRRYSAHKYYSDKKDYPLYKHMRSVGLDHFQIEEISQLNVATAKEAKKLEQTEIEKYDKAILLNALRAHSENHNKTRDQDKKRKNRRDFYARHKEDPEWMDKMREKGRIRMREKRANDPEFAKRDRERTIKLAKDKHIKRKAEKEANKTEDK